MTSRRDETRDALLHFVKLASQHIADVDRMRSSAIDDARHFGASDEQIARALMTGRADEVHADL